MHFGHLGFSKLKVMIGDMKMDYRVVISGNYTIIIPYIIYIIYNIYNIKLLSQKNEKHRCPKCISA